MLLQSHADEISLLPALPSVWPDGCIAGLRARGGFEVDIQWADGALQQAVIVSNNGGSCTVRYGSKTIDIETEAGKTYTLDSSLAVSQ